MSGQKIKILFVSSWFPNRVQPTHGTFVQMHAEAASLYADVFVLHVCFDTLKNNDKFETVQEIRNGINTIIVYVNPASTVLQKYVRYFSAYRKGLKMVCVKYGKPDIIHANVLLPVGLLFLLLKQFRKIPFVFTEHWTGYLPGDSTKIGKKDLFLSRLIARRAAMIMPVSNDLKNAMINLKLYGNYRVIPNVVNEDFFKPFIKKSIHDKVRFLHVSSLYDFQKNISGIIRTIHQLSLVRNDFVFNIITDGDAGPFIEMTKELGIADFFSFEYMKTSSEIASTMKQSDCLVMFSNFETFSVVIAEALACGLPVIATDAGGLAGDITKEQGIIIQPGDETALFNAMNDMIEHHKEYDKEKIKTFAQRFRYTKVGEQFLEIYKQVLNQSEK